MKSNIETFLRLKPISIDLPLNNSNVNINTSNEDYINSEIEYEIDNSSNAINIKMPNEHIKGYVNNNQKSYSFVHNGIFDQSSSQEDIFDKVGRQVIKNSIEGYNNAVFCYGQTGSGKTYTMCGSKLWKERGLIPRIMIDIFKTIREIKSYIFELYISYLEIYNENAYDLLDKEHSEIDLDNWKKIIVYEDNYGNIIMKNLSMIKVENEQQGLDLLITGNYIRHINSTQMNFASSRSHAIFTIILEGRELNSEVTRVSKINLVDLAGSERMRSNVQTQASVETKNINLSLSFLEQVILALNEKETGSRNHIPYRNSLMTTILKDSIGGNCKTILIANVSSMLSYLDETLSTMRFAVRCGKVQSEVSKNEHLDFNVMVHKLQNENRELRKQINELRRNQLVDLSNSDVPLNDNEKDECKVLISDYLNDTNRGKIIKAKSVNQLKYIIDFLIEYINKKENGYRDRMKDLIDENKRLVEGIAIKDEKMKKVKEIINRNNMNEYFIELD